MQSTPSTSRSQIRLRELAETYWFWPLLLGLSGLALAWLTLAIDQTYTAGAFYEAFPWISVPAESARAVLSVIATAMISAASIVYSLSLLIRNIAIGTLGPRLIEAFEKIRVNRFTLGMQLFSFVYCLTVLYGIGNVIGPRTLSVALGMVIALVALVYLVVFVHSVARQAHVDATIADIAEGLRERIDRETSRGGEPGRRPEEDNGYPVLASDSGYVQGIDRSRALKIACKQDFAVLYKVRSGDYVMLGLPLMHVFAEGRPKDEICNELVQTVTLGPERIDAEDLRFQCLLLVEIALRALSPGVNDPFTAVSCIDNLSSVLAQIDGRDLTPDPQTDDAGKARVYSRKLTYQDLVDSIFHPLRQSGAQVPTAAIRLLDRIGDLMRVTSVEDGRNHLLRHAELIAAAACGATKDQGDEQSFNKRLDAIRKAFKSHPESKTATG